MKKKAKKIILSVLFGVFVFIILGAVIISASIGRIVKAGAEGFLPQITGTKVSLESAGFSLLSGRVNIKNFIIYNPEGYKSEYAFKLGRLKIDLDLWSLFSDKIVVDEFLVDEMNVCYEQGLSSCNIYEIKKNIDKYSKTGKPQAPKEEEPQEESESSEETKAKRFQIGTLDFQNSHVIIVTSLSKKAAVKVPMPVIHMKDLGMQNENGETIQEMAPAIIAEIVKNTAKAVKDSSVEVSGKILDSLEESGNSLVDSVKDGGSNIVDGVKNLFK